MSYLFIVVEKLAKLSRWGYFFWHAWYILKVHTNKVWR